MSDDHHVAPQHNEEHIDPEAIVTWLDEPESLAPEERTRIEQHLAQCAECQQVAEEFRALVGALAALPEIAPPRSFGLTAEQVDRETATLAPPIPIRTPNRWYDRQMHAIRWATAVAAVLFVLVLGVDLVTTRFDRSMTSDTAVVMSAQDSGGGAEEAPAAAGAAMFAQEDETATSSAAEAEIAPGEVATPQAEVAESGETAAANEESEAPPAEDSAADAESTVGADSARQADVAQVDETSQPEQASAASSREERLRLIEFGLAAIFVWLLGLMIALPRLRRNRGNLS
ncbi:MAG: zf-HC2 domain-containing protein [Thermomicrobiales bacterium]|nr:zf-HC2 domain-containing protein [Thermomicrobiales bacterium]